MKAEREFTDCLKPTVKFPKAESGTRRFFREYFTISRFAWAIFAMAVVFAIWTYTRPAMILLPVDDVARMVAAKSKYDAAMTPINNEWNAARLAIIKSYNVPEGATPVGTVDTGQLTGWLLKDGTQITLKAEDRQAIEQATAKAKEAAKAPTEEFTKVEKDVKARNKVPDNDEAVFAQDGSVIAYKVPKK